MTTSARCPDRLELERLLLGRWPEDRAAVLEEHVSSCPSCGERLEQITASDELVQAVREVPAAMARLPRGAVVDALRLRVRQITAGSSATELTAVGSVAGTSSSSMGVDHTVFLDPPLEAGELGRLGAWRVVRLLGTGGMGVVFLAQDSRLRRLAALKVVLDARFADPNYLARFEREGQSLARLRHPNIVQIYEVGEHRKRPYLALEYIEGTTLAVQVAGTPQPVRFAAELVHTLAQAVHHAHEQGVVHRDLKPSNILLRRTVIGDLEPGIRDPGSEVRGQDRLARPESSAQSETPSFVPYITDFGLAKRVDETELTRTGDLMGTPGYIAPELTRGGKMTGDAERLVDVYSLGCILYEMLTGRPPFRGATAIETLDQARTIEPVAPSRLQPNLATEIDTICLKCLEKEPAKRYPSARLLADDLQRFLAGEPIQARPVSAIERLRKWAGRKPAPAALVALSLLSLFALMGGIILHNVRLQAEVARADRSEIAALEQQQRAELNFQQARNTINQMLDRLKDPRISDLPRGAQLRNDLQEDALAFFQGLSSEETNPDPAVRLDVALAYRQIGRIQFDQSRFRPAEENFEHAHALLQQMANAYPAEVRYQAHLAGSFYSLSEVALQRGRRDDAVALLRKALALLEHCSQAEPENLDWQVQLGNTYHQIGFAQVHWQNSGPEVESNWLRARAIRERLALDHPDVTTYRSALAESCINLGEWYGVSRFAEANENLSRAEALLIDLMRDHPAGVDYAVLLGDVYYSWGSVMDGTGDLEAAAQRFSQAIPRLEAALKQEPRWRQARRSLVSTLGRRALVYLALKRDADAAGDWNRSLQEVALLPAEHDLWVNHGPGDCAAMLARAAAHCMAATGAEALAARAGIRNDALYQLAAVWALCVPAVLRDPSINAPEREELAQHYASQSVALLEKLQAQGYFHDAQRLRTDSDLDPLRDRADFQKLLAGVESNPRQSP